MEIGKQNYKTKESRFIGIFFVLNCTNSIFEQKLIALSVIKKYFSFKKKDRLGFFILIIIVVILFAINLIIPNINRKEPDYDFSNFEAKIDSFENSLKPIEKKYISRLDQYIIDRYDSLVLFNFNPNTVSDEQWLKLGLTEKQISTINNYKSRGGKFFIKDDFRKIYGIRTKQFHILEPYIDLPSKFKKNYNSNKQEKQLFNFDPNNATESDLQRLGFYKNQISNIINYRSKGGVFKKKEDLKKIYSISEKQYQKFENFIVIEEKLPENDTHVKEIEIVELNSADIKLLTTLPGITDYLAERIIKYRNLLGGFYSSQQLKEVYGFKDQNYNQIKNYLTIDLNKIKKININFAEFKEIISHPYIDKNITLSIINYKQKNGFYSSLNQLVKNNVLTEKEYEKLKYYLSVE